MRLTLAGQPLSPFGGFDPFARSLGRSFTGGGVASMSVGASRGRLFRMTDAADLARFTTSFSLPFDVGSLDVRADILAGAGQLAKPRFTSAVPKPAR